MGDEKARKGKRTEMADTRSRQKKGKEGKGKDTEKKGKGKDKKGKEKKRKGKGKTNERKEKGKERNPSGAIETRRIAARAAKCSRSDHGPRERAPSAKWHKRAPDKRLSETMYCRNTC